MSSQLREAGIWLGFALLALAATLTVALPELSEDPESEGGGTAGDGAQAADEAVQAPATTDPN